MNKYIEFPPLLDPHAPIDIISGGKIIRLYRASDDNYCGINACFAENIDDARAYLDNPGFGGMSLYTYDFFINMDKVLDIYDDDSELKLIIARAIGYKYMPNWAEEDEGPEDLADLIVRNASDRWRRWPYVWEDIPEVKNQILEEGYTWIRYRDDFPENAITWVRLSILP